MIEALVSFALVASTAMGVFVGVVLSNRAIDRRIKYDVTQIDRSKPIIAPIFSDATTEKHHLNAELGRIQKVG